MQLKEFVSEWFERHKIRLNPDWAETIFKYHLPRIVFRLGDIELSELRLGHIAIWYEEECIKGPKALAYKCLVTLKSILNDAVYRGVLEASPAIKLKSVKCGKPRSVRFAEGLKADLLRAANARFRPYLLLAFHAPGRRKALLSLKVNDVDLAKGSVTYRKTKNGEDVTLPVPVAVLSEIMQHNDGEYVLPRYAPRSLSNAFSRLAVRLGYKGLRFHDIRHDVGTRLAESGVNQSVIAAILGHKDIRSTARYIHPSQESLREAMEKVRVQEKGV